MLFRSSRPGVKTSLGSSPLSPHASSPSLPAPHPSLTLPLFTLPLLLPPFSLLSDSLGSPISCSTPGAPSPLTVTRLCLPSPAFWPQSRLWSPVEPSGFHQGPVKAWRSQTLASLPASCFPFLPSPSGDEETEAKTSPAQGHSRPEAGKTTFKPHARVSRLNFPLG